MIKILVTGAKGMLGSDLCPILEKENFEVIKTDKNTLDITDFNSTQKTIEKYNPNIIIHCAAYTNVDKAESDLENAEKINYVGTQNLAKICSKKEIKLIYISTDYVFDGTKETPYETSDVPNPINNYGLTKLKGENAVKKYCKDFIIARTAWLYGLNGKNFVETMISLANKKELKVVNDQIGCPTWTVELSKGILNLIKTNQNGTFHVCANGNASWYDFAKEIFKLTDLDVNLIPCTTQDFPRPASRPKYSVMNNNGIVRDWKIALNDYIKLRGGK